MPNIAVLTSGGDSPGMNAAVMSVARASSLMGMNLIGIKRGFNGLIGKSKSLEDDIVHLTLDQVLDIADLPGTYLRTARCLEFIQPEYQDKAVKLLHDLIAIACRDGHLVLPASVQQGVEERAVRLGQPIRLLLRRVDGLADHERSRVGAPDLP